MSANPERNVTCEAIPSLVSAAAIFANAPTWTKEIIVSVYTGAIWFRFDGVAPVVGTSGHKWPAQDAPYTVNEYVGDAQRFMAIADGTVTGWITYLG